MVTLGTHERMEEEEEKKVLEAELKELKGALLEKMLELEKEKARSHVKWRAYMGN